MKEQLPVLLQISGILGGFLTVVGFYRNNVSGWVSQAVAAAERLKSIEKDIEELERRISRLESRP